MINSTGRADRGVFRLLAWPLAAISAVLLETFLFMHVMNARVNINEHLYLSAAYFYQNHSLYRDFAYMQMPLLVMIYGWFFKLTGVTHYLLAGRLFTLFFANLAAGLVFLFGKKFTRSSLIALLMALLFFSSQGILSAMKECSNYIAPIPFALAALYLFINGMENAERRVALMIFAGLLAAIAAGIKLWFAFLIPPFAIAILFNPGFGRIPERLRTTALPFFASLLIGFLPALYYLAADYHSFIFYNLLIHTRKEYFEVFGLGPRFPLGKRIWFLSRMRDSRLFFGIFLGASLASAATLVIGTDKDKKLPAWELALLVLVVVFALATLLTPNVLFEQYMSLPVAFIIVLAGVCCQRLAALKTQYLAFAMSLLTLSFMSSNLESAFDFDHPPWDYESWTVTQFRRDAQAVCRLAIARGGRPVLATPNELYGLESGMEVYPELTTGPFIYEVGDLIKKEGRFSKYLTYTSDSQLQGLLDKNPPGAILIEHDAGLKAFKQYALKNDFVRVRCTGEETIDVFVKAGPEK